MTTIGQRDRRIIATFLRGEPVAYQSGHKLGTDGRKLDGLWMGGSGLARLTPTGKLSLPDVGSRTAERVQRAIARADIALCKDCGTTRRDHRIVGGVSGVNYHACGNFVESRARKRKHR